MIGKEYLYVKMRVHLPREGNGQIAAVLHFAGWTRCKLTNTFIRNIFHCDENMLSHDIHRTAVELKSTKLADDRVVLLSTHDCDEYVEAEGQRAFTLTNGSVAEVDPEWIHGRNLKPYDSAVNGVFERTKEEYEALVHTMSYYAPRIPYRTPQ